MNNYMENKRIIGVQDVKTYRLQMVQDAQNMELNPALASIRQRLKQ